MSPPNNWAPQNGGGPPKRCNSPNFCGHQTVWKMRKPPLFYPPLGGHKKPPGGPRVFAKSRGSTHKGLNVTPFFGGRPISTTSEPAFKKGAIFPKETPFGAPNNPLVCPKRPCLETPKGSSRLVPPQNQACGKLPPNSC